MSYHPSIQRSVIDSLVHSFERDAQAKLESSSAVFHLVPGKVIFSDVVVKKKDEAFPVLLAKKSSIDFAPFQSIVCVKFVFQAAVFGLRLPLHRGIDGVFDVIDLFKELLSTKSAHILLRTVDLHGLSIGNISGAVSVESSNEYAEEKTNVCVDSGTFLFPVDMNKKYPSRIGKIGITVPGVDGVRKIYGEIVGKGDTSIIALREGESARMVIEHTKGQVKYRCLAPLDDVVACAAALFPEEKIDKKYAGMRPKIHGYDVVVKFRGAYEPDSKKGNLQWIIHHMQSSKKQQLIGVARHEDKAFTLHGDFKDSDNSVITFSAAGDVRQKKWHFDLKNLTKMTLPFGAQVEPGDFTVKGKRGLLGNVFGGYSVKALFGRERENKQLAAKGIYSYHDDLFSIVGKINDRVSFCSANCDDGFKIKRAALLDEKNNAELFLRSDDATAGRLTGKIKGKALAALLPLQLKSKIIGDYGYLELACDQSKMPERCSGTITVKDASFCVGGSSNAFLSAGMQFDIDFLLNAATFSEIELQSACGFLVSKEILLNWGDRGVLFAHIPFGVRNFLVNRGKDFYVIVDGDCAFDWVDGGRHSVDGSFIIKKSNLNNLPSDDSGLNEGGLYSTLLKKSEFFGVDGAITIKTQEPLSVNLPILRTNIHIDAKIDIGIQGGGSIIPKVSGTLKLDGGELDILGRSLRIMRGLIHILPAQNDNPLIDFLAYTNIKQYRIAIHGTGTLQRPHFVFESAPPLSQEQIIGLMLSGVEHADINQQLPGIFLQNIHKILQAPESGEKKNLFQALFNSLKYIQLLPYQDDLSSQKTVKARLNVDLGPHLRALFHKDILGKEAIALQFEYDVSNDVYLRFLRQASGFVGAEAEMRFKF